MTSDYTIPATNKKITIFHFWNLLNFKAQDLEEKETSPGSTSCVGFEKSFPALWNSPHELVTVSGSPFSVVGFLS